jgi:hypothetical protein
MTTAVKVWFCLTVATVSASIADPLLESASNAGVFGPGNFTDHSNWDVVPALAAAFIFAALHCFLRARILLKPGQPAENLLHFSEAVIGPSLTRLLPVILATQLAVLYVMETSEQIIVYGHVLGGSLWLGGPPIVSLAIHAAFCVTLAFASASLLRVLAGAAAHFVLLVEAFASLQARTYRGVFATHVASMEAVLPLPVLGRYLERGPPIPAL